MVKNSTHALAVIVGIFIVSPAIDVAKWIYPSQGATFDAVRRQYYDRLGLSEEASSIRRYGSRQSENHDRSAPRVIDAVHPLPKDTPPPLPPAEVREHQP